MTTHLPSTVPPLLQLRPCQGNDVRADRRPKVMSLSALQLPNQCRFISVMCKPHNPTPLKLVAFYIRCSLLNLYFFLPQKLHLMVLTSFFFCFKVFSLLFSLQLACSIHRIAKNYIYPIAVALLDFHRMLYL